MTTVIARLQTVFEVSDEEDGLMVRYIPSTTQRLLCVKITPKMRALSRSRADVYNSRRLDLCRQQRLSPCKSFLEP